MLNDLTNATPEEVIAKRENVTYCARSNKLYLNILALNGGRPYIAQRLTRFPGESTIDWDGTHGNVNKSQFGSSTVVVEGRKYRAYLVNHAARVAEKIRQYVFAKPPDRNGENKEMLADITRQGESINSFMGDVLKNIVATKWCWIGVDAPRVDGVLSIAQAQAGKIRPYWHLYSAQEVVDWHFDEKGELVWILTETMKSDNSDPFTAAPVHRVRRLWEIGKVTEYTLESGPTVENTVIDTQVHMLDLDFVPFVLCGEISDKPHWYDDVEDILRACLDLESSMDTLMHKTVFAQMVLPSSVAEVATAKNASNKIAPTVEAIVGLANAILEAPEDKGITRYIGPDANALKAMQDELSRKREELFDVVGLHLNFTKNFSESADSKHFDHLDPQAVLRNYAQQIVECELKAWTMTAKMDSSIDVIDPVYSDKFRVSNIYEDFKALVLASNMELPDSVMRLIATGTVDAVKEITDMQLTEEKQREIDKDIENMEFSEPIALDAASMAGKVVNGVTKQATDSGDDTRPSGAQVDA